MEILNLKVINLYGLFKDFMLYFFNNNIFAVDKYKLVAGFEVNCANPTAV